jgi:phage terminase small subunit
MSKLTDKEEKEEKPLKPEWIVFCHEYVIDWNGTRSYKVAYPKEKTDNTAAVNAHQLLRNPKITAYIEEIQQDMQKLAGISTLSNINHLKKILEEEEETTRDKIAALKVINDMLGLNAPVKSETKHEGGVTMFEIPKNGRGKND